MKIFRRIVFLIFLAIFLIGAPKLVFYALGYSFQPGKERTLVKTGLIYLSSAPPGAQVFVGGRRFRDPTPAMIRDLLPGVYPIRIELKDYNLWAQNVPVEAGKASVLGKILLHPKKPQWKPLLRGPFRELIAVAGTKYVLLRRDDGTLVEMYAGEIEQDDKRPARLLKSGDEIFRVRDIRTVRDSAFVLASGEAQGQAQTLLINLNHMSDAKPLEIDRAWKIPQVAWDARDEKHLFYLHDFRLNHFDVNKKEAAADFPPAIRGFALSDKKVFFLSGDSFFVSDFSGKEPKEVWTDADHFLEKGSVEIFPVDGNTAIFLDRGGRLLANSPPRILRDSGVLGFDYDKKSKRIAAWTDSTIEIIGLEPSNADKDVSMPQIKQRVVFQNGEAIRNVFWAYDGSHIIFQDQNRVYLLELETFGEPGVYELLETRGRSLAHYNDESGEIYYLDRNTGSLMALEIVPKWKVLEMPRALLQLRENEKEKGAA